jgi:hypothetical protein
MVVEAVVMRGRGLGRGRLISVDMWITHKERHGSIDDGKIFGYIQRIDGKEADGTGCGERDVIVEGSRDTAEHPIPMGEGKCDGDGRRDGEEEAARVECSGEVRGGD